MIVWCFSECSAEPIGLTNGEGNNQGVCEEAKNNIMQRFLMESYQTTIQAGDYKPHTQDDQTPPTFQPSVSQPSHDNMEAGGRKFHKSVHLTLKSHKILFVYNHFVVWLIVLWFCIEHDSVAAWLLYDNHAAHKVYRWFISWNSCCEWTKFGNIWVRVWFSIDLPYCNLFQGKVSGFCL